MKTKSLLYFIIFLQIIFTSNSFSQEKFAYGIKGGIGFWRYISLDNSLRSYSYPLGFSMGIYFENPISKDFSLVSGLLYQNISTKVTIYTAIEAMIDQEVQMQFINLPVLLKYKTAWLLNTYFIVGPSFTCLIKANYKYEDQVYGDNGGAEITKSFPSISTSIKFGLGKDFLLAGNHLLFELASQFGITKFKHMRSETEDHDLGSFRNSGIEFNIGLQL